MRGLRRGGAAVGGLLLLLGTAVLGEQGWLAVKAAVAERLIDRAFAAHLADGEAHRPWSWADTHPVARLSVPRLGVERTVLSGAAGPSLAFGPGHVSGTSPPNAGGNCAVAGHRDGWFAFLEELRLGDEILLETRGRSRRYVVSDLSVRSMWDGEVLAPTPETRLTLITCYPFGGLRPSELRYVVVGQPERECVTEAGEPAGGRTCAAAGAGLEAPGPAS